MSVALTLPAGRAVPAEGGGEIRGGRDQRRAGVVEPAPSRNFGPDTFSAATIRPEGSRTGAAAATRPGSISSSASA